MEQVTGVPEELSIEKFSKALAVWSDVFRQLSEPAMTERLAIALFSDDAPALEKLTHGAFGKPDPEITMPSDSLRECDGIQVALTLTSRDDRVCQVTAPLSTVLSALLSNNWTLGQLLAGLQHNGVLSCTPRKVIPLGEHCWSTPAPDDPRSPDRPKPNPAG